MKFTKKQILYFTILSFCISLILVITFKYLHGYILSRKEQFTAKNTNKTEVIEIKETFTILKKTTNYKKIYVHPKGEYSIWEPENIIDYYPMAHVYQKGIHMPTFPSPLLYSEGSDENSKPDTFIPIVKINENMAVWVPKAQQHYSAVGMVFSKNMPSKHTFRCPLKDNTDDIRLEKALYKNADYQIWKVSDNPFLVILNMMNLTEDKKPRGNIRKLLKDKMKFECDFTHQWTTEYKSLGNITNSFTKKTISIWRPLCSSEYVSLGDIAVLGNNNPNNQIKTLVVLRKHTKPPLSFGSNLSVVDVDADTDADDNNVANANTNADADADDNNVANANDSDTLNIWRPVPPKGYATVGLVFSESDNEPDTTSMIGCIPLEMTITHKNSCSSLLSLLWNNEPVSEGTPKSIWVDTFNYAHLNTKSTTGCSQLQPLILIDPKVVLQRNDKPSHVVNITFKRGDNNKVNYIFSEQINGMRNTLANLSQLHSSQIVFIDGNKEKEQYKFGIVHENSNKYAKKLRLHFQTKMIAKKQVNVYEPKTNQKIGIITHLNI